MTHDELRSLLPRYAAGELDPEAANAVREHLASGCGTCIEEVFRRPVGLPRASATPPPAGAPPARPAPAPGGGASRALVATVALLAAAFAALAGWSIAELRGREADWRHEGARLVEELSAARAARAALVERAAALERARTAAEEEAARQTEAARAAAEESAEARRALEAAQERVATLTRGVRRRDLQIERLLGSIDEERAARELLGTPDVEILRLDAMAPFLAARGHVLWHPARETVLLYAFDLPPVPPGAGYVVHLQLDGRRETGPGFRPGPRGDVVLPVPLGVRAGHLRAVEVVRVPDAQAVLAGRTGARG